jgi:hypothetical protein
MSKKYAHVVMYGVRDPPAAAVILVVIQSRNSEFGGARQPKKSPGDQYIGVVIIIFEKCIQNSIAIKHLTLYYRNPVNNSFYLAIAFALFLGANEPLIKW